jgi:hypothetical protein
MGKWLSERLGQEFVIENRSGATMNIATDVAVRGRLSGAAASPLERENSMTRRLIIVTVSAAALFSSPGFTQERSQAAASIPDFSGIWGNPYLYGIEPPLSGPGPVVNKARRRQTFDVDGRPLPVANAPLVSAATQLVGDYTNPILKPEAAEVVKKHAEMSLVGVGYPSPRNQCWPQGVPFIFTNDAVQLLQQSDKITMLYDEDHEVRRVRLNQPHPAQVTPSWYGDSVGHYEGDTLVMELSRALLNFAKRALP